MARELTSFEKAFIQVERKLALWTRGYAITFDEELIRQRGLGGFFRWAAKTDRVQNELIAGFGETRYHLVAAFASLWNGCDYCAYGHLLALNLCALRDTDALFPIDEQEVHQLLRLRDDELMAFVRERLGDSHADYVKLIERQNQLRFADGPLQGDDKLLVKAVALYEWINECSITVDAPAPPLGPIAKETALLERYTQRRAEARAKSPATAPAPQGPG